VLADLLILCWHLENPFHGGMGFSFAAIFTQVSLNLHLLFADKSCGGCYPETIRIGGDPTLILLPVPAIAAGGAGHNRFGSGVETRGLAASH
jgi:hypothetical protein